MQGGCPRKRTGGSAQSREHRTVPRAAHCPYIAPMPNPHDFAAAASQFADGLAGKFGLRLNAQPEDPLKSAVGDLLTALGRLTNREVDYRPEVRVEDVGRPDLGITVGGLLTGYIELKAPGLGARPENFAADSANGRQWRRFGALPNLIYTDGEEWSLYRECKLKARVRITSDLRAGGAAALEAAALPQLEQLLVDFLAWQPITPKNSHELAKFIAPYARILRNEVERAVGGDDSTLNDLAEHWRDILFPEADDAQFADAYAQTLTYALLLARFEGAESLEPDDAAKQLRGQHALLGDALKLLESRDARAELEMPIDLIERAIAAVDPEALGRADEQDPWLYFYEQFLAAYDKRLRKSRGVYFTPVEVVRCQVRLAGELLRTRFGKPRAFAEEEVTVLDPAVGSGAYPLAVIEHAEQATREYSGAGMVAERLRSLAQRLYAFELLVGPYAVAHLRIAQRLRAAGVDDQPPRVYLTDTLASPHQQGDTPPILQQLLPSIPREWEQAQQVKGKTRIVVCLGNPPYDRQQIDAGNETEKRKGGWVRYGEDEGQGTTRPILNDFLDPLKQAGQGRDATSLYNDYVYFWRWALWKVFDSAQKGGIVSFITASSYLRGPGFLGMRRVMREVFDELWIIDLEGDNRGPRKTANVFDIQSPVAIAIGMRSDAPNSQHPASVWKVRLTGSRAAKLARLDEIESFGDLEWEECESAWDAPYFAIGTGEYFEWPCVTDVFPWQHAGVKVARTWPIGITQAQLAERWHNLLARSGEDRRNAFRETRDLKVGRQYLPLSGSNRAEAIASLESGAAVPQTVRYSYRSFDHQYVIADSRVGDFMRPDLWRTCGPQQAFITSLLTELLGRGPAATACADIPDLHYFRGSFGGKGVIPLWRDAEATEPNVTGGLLAALEAALDYAVSAPDLFAYAYAVLAQPAYVERFWNQLEQPPPRLPITKDGELFRRAARHGARLLYLHTYGERFGTPEDDGTIAPGEARCTVAVPHDEYPDDFRYEEQTRTLHIGKGQFAPVAPAVWSYSVSGLQVVKSWLDYRKRKPSGKKSSPLDEIRPERWEFGDELLELLWVLERTVALEPEGEALLEEILESNLFTASELPMPQPHERKPPSARGNTAPLGGG